MKHKIFIYAIILTLAIPQGVMAYDFSAVAPSGQTLYYNIVNGEAQVTHDGSYSVFVSRGNDYVIGDIVIPLTVTYNDIEYTVTSIEDNAFYGCNFITSVVLPNTITSIGSQSFYGTELVNIIVPDGVASIGNWAFSTVRHIEYHGSASYNSNYQYWSAGSMNGYSEGDFIYYSNSKTYLLAYIGNDVSVSIPSSVTYIGEKAFQYCRNLESVNIHNNVTYIDDQAFSYCSGLTMVNIPGSVSTIGKDAFSESGLASVTIGDGVKTLKYGAFFCCENLTSVNIPSSVTSIGENAFGYCNSLATMTVASGNSHYDSRDNCNAIIESSSNKLVSGCQTTVIPNTVTSIGNSAFYFISGLSSIIIPNSVTTIGKYAFFDCLDLASITIPSSVTTIGESAFSCCYGLTEITSLAEVPPTLELGSSVFNLVSVQTPVYVPCGSVAGYKSTSGWNYFYNIQEVAGCPRTVTVAVNDEAMGSVTGGGTYTDGATVTLTATPNCGYRFVGWKNSNNETVSTDATYSFTVTSDTTVTAEFEAVTEFNFVAPSGQTLHYIVNGCNVTVSYPGSYNSPYSGYTKPTGDLVIPTLVEYNGISYTVTSIGEKAFYGCSGLTLVSIPNSVTSIRGQAFWKCSGLTSVTIPNSVTEISNGAFNYCSGLISITVESGNMVYDSRENCNAIIRTAFNTLIAGCKNTVVPNSVTAIGSVAFYGCSGLTSVTIPNSVTSIGDESFRHCSGLTSVTIPNSVTEIGGYAFNNCSSLETITVEEGNAVYDSRNNCNAIINTSSNELIFGCIGTVIPNSVATIGQYAFRAVPIVAIDIPNTVSRIRNYAFNGCNNLTSITLPDSLKIVEWGSFESCQNLTSVIINNAATKIENYAFAHCPNLSYVTLGKSMSYLDLLVFFESKSIMTIYCKALVPPICAYSATLPGGTIYVPCDALSNYQTAPHWQNRNLVGMPFLQYDMEFLSGNTTMGNVSTGEATCDDDNIELIAMANEGCQFVQWSDGTTSNPYFLHVTSDTTVTALFDYVQYSVTGNPANPEQGSVEGGGNYYAGSTATLTATPACGYHFVCWRNSSNETISTANPCDITITSDTSFTAEFEVIVHDVICPSGQHLYYNINCATNTAIVAAPPNYVWDGYVRPSGNVVIPSSIIVAGTEYPVTAIGAGAFGGCQDLTSVIIPSSVTKLESSAFEGCYGLTSVNIPTTITEIKGYTFKDCVNLSSITIPTNILSISQLAFGWCGSLTNIQVMAETPPYLGGQSPFEAFHGVPTEAVVQVPCGSLTDYQTANGWSNFTNLQELFPYTLTVSSNDEAMGTVSLIHTPTCSDNVAQISANAASGYVFVRWSDGNTHTPRTVAVVSDTAIEALFESVPTPTVDCGEYQWPVVPSPYIEVQIKQKHDHLSAYAVLGWDTVVTQNQPTLTLSCMPYVPVLFFNGTYTVEEIPYNPADPTFHQGTRMPTNTDDIFGPATPIPFPFYFFGERKTAFVLGANGLVTFNTAAAGQFCAYSYSAGIPWPDGTAGAPQGLTYMRDAIYGIYEDTYPSPTTHGSTGDPNWGMYYGIQDNMPGRKIVCSWNDIPLYGNTCTSIRNSYQIICYEGTNIIEVHVKQRQACQSWRNGFGIIGIQNATGLPQQPSLDPLTGNSHVVPGSPAAFYPAGKNPFSTNLTEVAYRFTPQGESLYTYKWYRIFDDGRDSVELTTNTNEPNGYYLPMDATSSCPMLTRAVVSPTESSSYVFELRFRTANGDWYLLRDTCRVGVDIPVSQYTVTATSANENMGTVTGGGTYDSGSTATLTATPNGDYRFVRWKNSYGETLSTQRTFDLTVTQDTTLTAIFEEGMQDTVIYVKLGVVGDSIFSKENQQTMVVTHQEVTHVKLGFRVEPTAESIQLLDQNETLIGTFEDSAEPTQIYRLTTGTYIIRAVFPSGDTFQQTINFENVIHY